MNNARVIDPLTKALIHASFLHIMGEAAEILEKTAISSILCEARDYCLALLDRQGRLLSIAEKGNPLHVASAELQIKAALDKFGDDFQPGDVILENDSYTAYGNHLPDWTFIRPIFVENELTFFALCKGHQADTKGAYPGGYFPGGYDVQSEGLLIPPTKVFKKGERQEVHEFILHNVRWSEAERIDNAAMIASLKKAEEKAIELCKRYGKATILGAIDILIDDAEKAVRAEISQWPDGTYYGEGLCDRDGSGTENVTVRADVTIKGDEITVDFSKTDKQVTFVNSPIGCTHSVTYLAFIPMFDPNIMTNHGKLKPIKIIAPKGTVVNPEYPATIGACAVFVGDPIIESIQMAMGKAIPDKVCAAWAQHMAPVFIGQDPRTKEAFWLVLFQGDGGSGAVDGYDGCPNVAPANAGGGLWSLPVELTEIKFPWRILKWELLTDSSGAGKYRGGLGIDWIAVNEGGKAIGETGSAGGENWVPFGQKGGKSGIRSGMTCIRGGKEEYRPTFAMWPVEPEDIIHTTSTGGGGHGNPFERPIEKVKKDVRNGYVSVEKAREGYGVVINPETFEVDLDATNKLRKEPK